MKKLLAILAVALLCFTSASAKDRIYRDAKVLPGTAQQIMKKHFPKSTINRVKVDENMFGYKDYEVITSDGFEIEFDKNGEWKEVDGGHRAIPAGFVIAPIQKFLKANHGNAYVVKIDKDRNDYDVELSDGTELKFDRSGAFLRYDD